ncbi:MAG: TonB-dependent receptor plug domain-containing protein [Verrucomicrobiota bacterium]
MENHLAPLGGNKRRHLSTLALANVIVMAGASKAADTTASTDASPSATPSSTPQAAAPSGRVAPMKSSSAAPAAATASTAATPTATLDEVVVSATPEGSYETESSGNGKYTEPLLNTPQTITVIPQQLIKDQNATTLQQALQNVPGITFGAGGRRHAAGR